MLAQERAPCLELLRVPRGSVFSLHARARTMAFPAPPRGTAPSSIRGSGGGIPRQRSCARCPRPAASWRACGSADHGGVGAVGISGRAARRYGRRDDASDGVRAAERAMGTLSALALNLHPAALVGNCCNVRAEFETPARRRQTSVKIRRRCARAARSMVRPPDFRGFTPEDRGLSGNGGRAPPTPPQQRECRSRHESTAARHWLGRPSAPHARGLRATAATPRSESP